MYASYHLPPTTRIFFYPKNKFTTFREPGLTLEQHNNSLFTLNFLRTCVVSLKTIQPLPTMSNSKLYLLDTYCSPAKLDIAIGNVAWYNKSYQEKCRH